MRKIMFCAILTLTTMASSAQIDTIYAGTKKIACNVIELGAESVKFTYPGESLTNTLYNNAILKIIFKSGRVQEFAAQTSFRTLKSPSDWESVSLASVESEVLGLYKLGEVSSKAAGTTEFANQERVKMRAIRKLKMDAALMGANVIYVINMRSEGNRVDWSGFGYNKAAETSLTGIAYTNQPILIDQVKHFLAQRAGGNMTAVEEFMLNKGDADMKISQEDLPFTFSNVTDQSGTIFVEGTIKKVRANSFQVVYLTPNEICLRYQSKDAVYVYKIK